MVETHNAICDKVVTEISTRSAVYKMVLNHFEPFFNPTMNNDEINKYILKLSDLYKNDIDICYFSDA